MNMHTLQTMLETYAVDWGGVYPENIKALKNEAVAGEYWKNIENPYTTTVYRSGTLAVLADKAEFDFDNNRFFSEKAKDINKFNWDSLSFEYDRPESTYKGFVIYVPKKSVFGEIREYCIYGTNLHGKLFSQNGSPYLLSNG